MKNLLLLAAIALLVASLPGHASETPARFSMLGNGIRPALTPDLTIKTACTGANTCCCRTNSQIFCSTPDACSRAGGACSAGCN